MELDYKDLALRIPLKTKVVCFCIILAELCERLTYYSAVENLMLYCMSVLQMGSYDATTVRLVFAGTAFGAPLLVGGYIADSAAGKYNTILGSSLLYLIGLVLLPASSADYSPWFDTDKDGGIYDLSLSTRKVYFFMALVFVGIGTGGIKTNVGPFGAEQIEQHGEAAVRSFFNWFYFGLNIGATIAFLGVAYIQQNISFAIGFCIPLASMVMAVFSMIIIKSHSIRKSPSGKSITNSLGKCIKGKFNRKGKEKFDQEKEQAEKSKQRTGTALKTILTILPILFLHIIYFTPYALAGAMNNLQALRMDVSIGEVKMPIAALGVVNTFVVLALIPLVDKVVYPLLERRGIRPTQLQRIGFGYVLSILSLLCSGIVEIFRKRAIREYGTLTQNLGGKDFDASTVSVFWQIPQVALMAASEIFANITTMEFSYLQAPKAMKGVVMSLYLIVGGFASYITQGVLKTIQSLTGTTPPDAWFPDELNDGKAENIYFLAAGIMCMGLLLLIVYSKCSNKAASKSMYSVEVEGTYDDDTKVTGTSTETVLVKYENKGST